jgi:hypothetical protein
LGKIDRVLALHFLAIVIFLIGVAVYSDNIISMLLRIISSLLISFYLIGDSAKAVLRKIVPFSEMDFVGEAALSILLSFSYFFIISVVFSSFFLLSSVSMVFSLIATLIILDIIRFSLPRDLKGKEDFVNRNFALVMLPIVSIGFLLAVLFKSNFIWPSMPGWDVYPYLAGSNWIFEYHGIASIFPSYTSLVPPSSYLFQILVASFSSFSYINPYLVFWGGPFLAIPLFGALIYMLASIICLFIPGGDIFLGPQYFFPSTLSLILFLLITIFMLTMEKSGKAQLVLVSYFLVIYYSIYYFPILITLPLFSILIVKKTSQGFLRRHFKMLSGMLLVSMVFLSWLGAFLLSDAASSVFQKFGALSNEYSGLLLFLFSVGILFVIYKKPYLFSDENRFIIIAYSLSLLLIYFMPPVSTARVEEFLRGFMSIVISVPLFILHTVIEKHGHNN